MAGQAVNIANSAGADRAEVDIRPARLADIWALYRLQRRCFPIQQAYGPATLAFLHLWPPSRMFVAWDGEQVAGCVVADSTRDGTRILNLCVDPDYRRRGIATVLLSVAEDAFGNDRATLMVEDKNLGAQTLYRECGYLPVSDLRHYYGRNRHGVLMQKQRRPQ